MASTALSRSKMETPKPDVSIFDLLNAVNAVLKRFEKRDDARDIFEDKMDRQ